MLSDLPKRAFFRFEFPIHYIQKPPVIDGSPRKWKSEYLLPPLVELDDEEVFADVYAAWNEAGLYVAFDVPQRRSAPRCDADQWWKHDGIRLCVDTRDARDIKRATRFCHLFYLLPTGGGANRRLPLAGLHRMSRSKEPPPPIDVGKIKLGVQIDRAGYTLEAALPASCLNGWDPHEHSRIGFYYKVKDLQLGDQHLTVDDELGWNVDPSTWATAVLKRDFKC